MKSGFVAIVGKPNVGKSTIINGLLGQKLAIVSPKAETTRNAIKGIYRDDDSEITFIDTPGLFEGKTLLDRYLHKEASKAARDVDAEILVIDGSKKFDEEFVKMVNPKLPLIVVINKIDLLRLPEAVALKEKVHQVFKDAKIIEMSAIENFGFDELLKTVKSFLEEGPSYYGENSDFITDKNIDFFVGEIIREKALVLLRDEVPHHLAVKVVEIKNKKESALINATIVVSRASHKAIVIGKAGSTIKRIGTSARKALEEYLNKRVFLELFVSVKEDWLNNQANLKDLGYR